MTFIVSHLYSLPYMEIAYSRRQMMALNAKINASRSDIPAVISPSFASMVYRFGQPHIDILKTFLEVKKEYGIVLDLLYGAPAWSIMSQSLNINECDRTINSNCPLRGRTIMYVHTGGLEGITSQLLRYKHKNLLSIHEIQLPK